MYAHEALLLGSMSIKPTRLIRHTEDGGGCALGMIEVACGAVPEGKFKMNHGGAIEVVYNLLAEQHYNWLANGVTAPCRCFAPDMQYPATMVIMHLFDHHVPGTVEPRAYHDAPSKIAAKYPWTIEQLADWIRSVDPTITTGSAIEQEAEAECQLQQTS